MSKKFHFKIRFTGQRKFIQVENLTVADYLKAGGYQDACITPFGGHFVKAGQRGGFELSFR